MANYNVEPICCADCLVDRAFQYLDSYSRVEIFCKRELAQDLIAMLIESGAVPYVLSFQYGVNRLYGVIIDCKEDGVVRLYVTPAYDDDYSEFLGGASDSIALVYTEDATATDIGNIVTSYGEVELFTLDDCDCDLEEVAEISQEDGLYKASKTIEDENGWGSISVSGTDKDYVEKSIKDYENEGFSVTYTNTGFDIDAYLDGLLARKSVDIRKFF